MVASAGSVEKQTEGKKGIQIGGMGRIKGNKLVLEKKSGQLIHFVHYTFGGYNFCEFPFRKAPPSLTKNEKHT